MQKLLACLIGSGNWRLRKVDKSEGEKHFVPYFVRKKSENKQKCDAWIFSH